MPPRPRLKAATLPLALARQALDHAPIAPAGRYGDNATHHQILANIDTMGAAIDRGGEYVSPLWPPPGHPAVAHRPGCGRMGQGCVCRGEEKPSPTPQGQGHLRLVADEEGR